MLRDEIGVQESGETHNHTDPGGEATKPDMQPKSALSPAANTQEIGVQFGDETHKRADPGGEATIFNPKPRKQASPAANIRDDQVLSETQLGRVVTSDEADQVPFEAHVPNVGLIAEIREQWKRRQAWHRAEKSLTLQAKAQCRRLCGGDKTEAEKLLKAVEKGADYPGTDVAFFATVPFLEARRQIAKSRTQAEKHVAKLAKDLPAYEWWCAMHGCNALGFAGIIGESGDLSDYANPAKLWKRLGLAVIDGGRQRRVSGADALEHGFAPERRAFVWTLGVSIKMNGAGNPYRDIYAARKEYELTRCETKGHADNRAKRYMEKRLIRDLWAQWRKETNQ